MEHVVQVGSCGDVCLKADTFGVIYISPSSVITCASCRYGKTTCQHVRKLTQLLKTEDIPSILSPFLDLPCHLEENASQKKYPVLTCLSSRKIPFRPTHDTTADVVTRFHMTGNVALLFPDECGICKYCGHSNWIKDEDLFFMSTIVTMNSFVNAKGTY